MISCDVIFDLIIFIWLDVVGVMGYIVMIIDVFVNVFVIGGDFVNIFIMVGFILG